MRRFLRNFAPTAASLALYTLAFPPFNLTLIVFVAIAPWLASLRNLDKAQAIRSGYAFGVGFWLIQVYWLVPFVGRWTGNFALALIPLAFIAITLSLYFALLGWLVHTCYDRSLLWAIPFVWAGFEAARSLLPGFGFPWGLIAFPLWRLPQTIQLAAFGGIFLVSAWVVLANVIAAEAFWARIDRKLYTMVVVFVMCLATSLVRHAQPNLGKVTPVTLGQVGVDMAFGDPATQSESLQDAVKRIMALTTVQNTRLAVFPEGMSKISEDLPPLSPFGSSPPVPVLFGGQRSDPTGASYQTAYAFDGRWQFADKTRLVAFGEYVPFRDHIPFLESFRLPSGDLRPGERSKTLTVAGIKVGPILCFEGLFSDIAQKHAKDGAQMLAIMSIDDWYQGSNAPEQLYGSAAWRAAETGLPVVRVASLGTTGAFDSRGNQISVAPEGQLFGLRVEVPIPRNSDALFQASEFPKLCWLVMIYFSVLGFRKQAKKGLLDKEISPR